MDEILTTVTRGAWAQCWQVTALIAIVGVVVKFAGRDRPHLASVLWLVVLVKCITPPVVSCPWGVFCWLQQTATASPSRPATDATVSVRYQSEQPDSDVDAVVARLPSPDGEEGILDREPRSGSWLASGEKAGRWSFSARTVFIGSIATAWLAGCALFVGVTIAQLRSCRRKLAAAGEVESPEVVKLLEAMRQRLELRRSVKLWVTPSLFGPAVIGILRPTIILPAALVSGKSPTALEPLLAHELMHIRRGDLWTGLLQTLAVGLWWFHPLVRLASRLLTREAERCCDEQVIAYLRYDPRVYAQSLVDVLALKQQLHSVPVCPGVRPIDITRQRLERIMRLGQGCHKRTPWWCWAAMLILALAALPGAALLARRQALPIAPPGDAPWAKLQISANDFVRLRGESSTTTAPGPAEELTTRTLEVSDLLSEIEEHYVEEAAPATGGAEDVSKKPDRPVFAADKVVAKVGDKVVLYEEISPTVALILSPLLAKAKTEVERDAIERQREPLTKSVIQQAVQNKMLLIEFERTMPNELRNDPKKRAESEAKVRKQINKTFENALSNVRKRVATASQDDIDKMMRSEPAVVRLALLMKERRLESPGELDTALREFGTTLQQQAKYFGEHMMGMEAARTSLNKKRAAPEEELLNYYQDHLSDYYMPAQARFEILTANYARFNADRSAARDHAAKMRDEVQAGKPFAEVARSLSQEPRAEKGGFYDWLSPGSLASQPIDRAVFTLDVSQLSPIIEDEHGCHVVRVIERRDGRQMAFAEASPAIQKEIETRNRKEDQQLFLDSMRARTKVWTIFDE